MSQSSLTLGRASGKSLTKSLLTNVTAGGNALLSIVTGFLSALLILYSG